MRYRRFQRVDNAGARIDKNSRTRHDLCGLGSGKWNLDHLDSKQRSVRILIRSAARTSGELFVLPNERRSRNIYVDILFVVRIDDQGMRMRTATCLNGCDLFGVRYVRDVEDAHTAKSI